MKNFLRILKKMIGVRFQHFKEKLFCPYGNHYFIKKGNFAICKDCGKMCYTGEPVKP